MVRLTGRLTGRGRPLDRKAAPVFGHFIAQHKWFIVYWLNRCIVCIISKEQEEADLL